MAVIFDSLKKTLDDIALFVQLRIKVMLNFEIGFIGDTSKGSMLSDEKANFYRRATSRLLALSKPNMRSDAPCRKWNQAQAR